MPNYMPCPACMMQGPGAVSETNCPVCKGQARLRISDPAAKSEGARIASSTVWLGLARAARKAVETYPPDDRKTARRDELADCTQRFYDANLLGTAKAWTGPGTAYRFKNDSWENSWPASWGDPVKASTIGSNGPLTRSSLQALHADHRPPGPECRPLSRGGLPILSEHGHPSDLARVADPYDMKLDNRERCDQNARQWREADTLDRAVTVATQAAARAYSSYYWPKLQTDLFDIVGMADKNAA